jgi:hypothetical protein
MDVPELYCLTFGAEPASGLGQSSTADQPWMAHGGNSMGPFEWSHIYIRWEVLSHELQNGPCRKTFELEYLEIFALILIRNNCGPPATILVRKYFSKLFSWNGQKFHFQVTPVARLKICSWKKSPILRTFPRTLSFRIPFYCVLYSGLWSGFMNPRNNGVIAYTHKLPRSTTLRAVIPVRWLALATKGGQATVSNTPGWIAAVFCWRAQREPSWCQN